MIALSKETPTVYLLDDDASVLKATRRLLDSVGWKVEAFTDPIAFLGRAAVDSPSVAVIDIDMPVLDGFGLLGTEARPLEARQLVGVLLAGVGLVLAHS